MYSEHKCIKSIYKNIYNIKKKLMGKRKLTWTEIILNSTATSSHGQVLLFSHVKNSIGFGFSRIQTELHLAREIWDMDFNFYKQT